MNWWCTNVSGTAWSVYISFLEVINGHAESKCTYFMAGEITRNMRYVNHEI